MLRGHGAVAVTLDEFLDAFRVAPLVQEAMPVEKQRFDLPALLRGQPGAHRRGITLLVAAIADGRLAMAAQILAQHPFGFAVMQFPPRRQTNIHSTRR